MTSNAACQGKLAGDYGVFWHPCAVARVRNRQHASRPRLRWNEARSQVKFKLASDQFAAGNIAAAADELAAAARLTPDKPDPRSAPGPVSGSPRATTARAAEMLERAKLEGPAPSRGRVSPGNRASAAAALGRGTDHVSAGGRTRRRAGRICGPPSPRFRLQLGQPQAALDYLARKIGTLRPDERIPGSAGRVSRAARETGRPRQSAWQRVNCEHGPRRGHPPAVGRKRSITPSVTTKPYPSFAAC